MSKFYLADDVLGRSRFIWAAGWEEAEQICEFEKYELVGEYVESQIWWDMPKWMEQLSERSK